MVRNVETAAENRPVHSVLSYVRESTVTTDDTRSHKYDDSVGVGLPAVHHPVTSFLGKLRIGKEEGPELSWKLDLPCHNCNAA